MSMIDMFKQMAGDTIGAGDPVNIVIGTVTKVSPIEIEISQKLKLTKEFLIITERVTRYEVDLEHNHGGTNALGGKLTDTPIRTGLKTGDRVLLIRVQGGQQYVVVDKVVD